MKHTKFIILLWMLVLIVFCTSNAIADAKVTKWKGQDGVVNVKIGKDSVSISGGYYPNTITIALGNYSDYVDVEIYQHGTLISKDREKVESGTTINYTITDAAPGTYDVFIRREGKLTFIKAVSLEE